MWFKSKKQQLAEQYKAYETQLANERLIPFPSYGFTVEVEVISGNAYRWEGDTVSGRNPHDAERTVWGMVLEFGEWIHVDKNTCVRKDLVKQIKVTIGGEVKQVTP